MSMSRIALGIALLLATCAVLPTRDLAQDESQLPANYVPSGATLYRQYCASCHGIDGKGHGPARVALRIPAPDLTTLAKRHGGKFPVEYVASVLQFGPGVFSHGSAKMPIWGQLFDYYYNEDSAKRRVQNLIDYLSTLQERQ
jgi:mono/diheme cytochrome c family protein